MEVTELEGKNCVWKQILQGLLVGQLSFLMRAGSDTLPTPINLRRWRIKVDSKCCLCENQLPAGVSIHWTGLLDWTTGLDYWTDIFASKNLFFCPVISLAYQYMQAMVKHSLLLSNALTMGGVKWVGLITYRKMPCVIER